MGSVAGPPSATITNGELKALVYLPDAKQGFYRGTRFDWSGVVASLEYQGHNFVGPWYQDTDPKVLDFEYRADKIVTGPSTSMVGFPEEFSTAPSRIPLGWDEAKAGGTFVKIGVGLLRKPDDEKYDHFRLYPIVDGSRWSIKRESRAITFRQSVLDKQSGYGYTYVKKVSLTPGKAQLVIEHSLRNTGVKLLRGQVYDHNFTRWDGEPPNPDYQVSLGFEAAAVDTPAGVPWSLNGRSFRFTRPMAEKETLRITPTGFGATAADYDFRIENSKLGIGMHITADRPLAQLAIWGIRSVFAVEPFIAFNVEPGKEFSWRLVYDAYVLNR
jgi:hypothetical protein